MSGSQTNIKVMVRGAYDVQKLRIQMGNRIVANFKTKLGQAPGEDEEVLDEDGKRVLNDLRVRFRKITDGVKTEGFVALQMGRKFVGSELKKSYWDAACRNLSAAKIEQGGLFADEE